MGRPDTDPDPIEWQDGRGNSFLGSELYGEDSVLSAEDTGRREPERWILGSTLFLAPQEEDLATGASSTSAEQPDSHQQAPGSPCLVADFNPHQPWGMAWGPTCLVHQHFIQGVGWRYRSWTDHRACSSSFPYCTTGRSASPTSLALLGLQKDDPALQETEAEGGRERKRARSNRAEKEQEGEKET